MKKFATLLTTLALVVLVCVPAHAESILLNGQKHYYTVQLRSDKRAIVYARIIFENPSADNDLSSYEFSLPSGVSVQNLSAQQVLAKASSSQTCKTYETIDQWRARVNKYSYTYSDTSYQNDKQCVEWQPAAAYDDDYDYDKLLSSTTNYYSYNYYKTRDSKFDYVDLTQKNSGSNYTVSLSEPVKPKKQGSLLISFTTGDFITGGMFGRYDYNVRTLLAKQMIDQATVSINFDNDMFTRDAKQKRTYETSSLSINEVVSSAAYQSSSMDSLLGNIGSGGIYVKTQSSLIPGDTLSVTGVFGTNQLVLFSDEILITLLTLALLGVAFRIFMLWRKAHHPRKSVKNKNGALKSTHNVTGTATNERFGTVWGKIAATSVASIIGTIVISLALTVVLASASSGYSATGTLASIGYVIVLFFGIMLLPGLYIARYGVKNVFRWATLQFAIVLILLLILALLMSVGGSTNYYH